MATPVDFEGANSILYGGSGDVRDLSVFSDGHQVISCWRLSPEELQLVAQTGVIWFCSLGKSHPPVLITVEPQVFIGPERRPAKAEPILPRKERK